MASVLLLPSFGLHGQTAALSTPSPHVSATTHRHKRHHRRSRAAREEAQTAAVPATPAPPQPPADQPPAAATVSFQNGALTIQAHNSSLEQILNQVSQQTGMAIEGSDHDKRIYGDYGPGTVSATMEKLLNGAGYNYVLVGGGDGRPPSKLLLTAGNAGSTSTPASSTPAVQSTPPPQATAPENPSNPVHPKTPQEIFEELKRMHPH
jgi:hypothetical protein